MTVTPETIELLKRLEAAATKGEWKTDYDTVSQDYYLKVELPCINGLPAWFQLGKVRSPDYAEMQMTDGAFNHGENNAAFICAARNHLRELIEWGEGLQKQLRSMTAQRDLLSANAVQAENKLDEFIATHRQKFISEAIRWMSEQTSAWTHDDFREGMTIKGLSS